VSVVEHEGQTAAVDVVDVVVDVAVVGGGVAGAYAAYRLTDPNRTGAPPTVELYELSDRIGGRLWSVGLDGIDDLPAEIGGMYFSDLHENVFGLINRELGLHSVDVALHRDLLYLRGHRLHDADFSDPTKVPYNLRTEEQSKTAPAILVSWLETLLPDLTSMWPMNASAPRGATIEALRALSPDGRPLHEWGFWNLLAEGLSNEAHQLIVSTIGSTTLFQNWNAYNAIYDIVTNLAGNYHKLPGGYQQLPEMLASGARDRGASIHFGHRLERLTSEQGHLILEFATRDGEGRSVRARQVILAMPQRSLELIESPDVLFGTAQFRSDFRSVTAAPAAKVFLAYDEPWWESVPGGPGTVPLTSLAVSYTDLPMRQCYYIGASASSGKALLMASYGDGAAASFWAGFLPSSQWGPDLIPFMSSTEQLAAQQLDSSAAMIKGITSQLAELHGVDVPEPIGALFHDWSEDPYGGGWHMWTPFVESWKVTARVQRPNPDHAVYLCGESFSLDQGWVEGAINTTEMMLQQQFDLDRPSWVGPDYDFGST
jgi:monoamine oxidase